MNNDANATTGLADYGRIVREQWWVILAVTLVCVGASIVLTLRQDTRYAATAQLDYAGESQSLGIVGAPTFPSRTNKELAEYGAQTILQVSSLHKVREALATSRSVSDLREDLVATVDPQSNLVSVIALADDPNFAAALANQLAVQTTNTATTELRQHYRDAALDLRRREITLGRGAKDVAQSALYDQQITRLQALANIAQPISVVRQAQPESDPVSPKPVRNGVLGAVVGLLLGLLAAFVRDTFDKRLRNLEDVNGVLDMPVVGHLRDEAMGGAGALPGAVKLAPIDLETFSVLRANLRHLGGDRPRQAIAVTSAGAGEGKSTIAASLALSSALAGQRTLLVECDLRRPSLARRLGLPPGGLGLSDYLDGTAAPSQVVRSIGAPGQGGNVPPLPLAVVLAGTPTSAPVELLGSPTFADFVVQVRAAYEVIVFDTCPLLTVADTLELLPHVDATVMCVRAGQTTQDQARAAGDVLERVPHGAVGLVITGVKRGQEAVCGYYSSAYERRVAVAA
jgi:capsular exopolysaccharide synthesis family protein